MTLVSLIFKDITTLVTTVPGVLFIIYLHKCCILKLSFRLQLYIIKVQEGFSEAKVDNEWAGFFLLS
jgi:hypothetical protein